MKWFVWRVSFLHCKSNNIILHFMCIPCRKSLEIRVSAIQIVECLYFQRALCNKFKHYKKDKYMSTIHWLAWVLLFFCLLVDWLVLCLLVRLHTVLHNCKSHKHLQGEVTGNCFWRGLYIFIIPRFWCESEKWMLNPFDLKTLVMLFVVCRLNLNETDRIF